MNKVFLYVKYFTLAVLGLFLVYFSNFTYVQTSNNTQVLAYYEETTVPTTSLDEGVTGEELEEIVEGLKEEVFEVKEEVKETTVKQEVKQETKTTIVKKETAQPKEDIRSKFNLGTISISNSNFSKDIIMDDGTYYYLNHDLNGKYNGVGMPIIDSRTNFNTRKTILYAHSAKNGGSPFNYLQNYNENESFFRAHRYITITYNGQTYQYEIFSVYVSLADDDYSDGLEYFRRMSYTDAEWGEQLEWYKSNSDYDTGVHVADNDKILILQTCSMNNKYYNKGYYRANLVVMAKLI